MADFNAAEAVPAVHVSFAPHSDFAIEVPEPSHGKISKFKKFVASLQTKAAANLPDGELDTLGLKARLELIGHMLDVDDSQDQVDVIRNISELTTIPQTEIKKVPWRVQQALFGHLVQEFLNPEAQGTAATS